MAVVAEHVQARARRRQQHGVAGKRGARGRAHRFGERRAGLERAHARECARDQRGVAANEHRMAHLPRKAAARGAKSWFLPSPPAIITSGPAMPATAASVAPTLVPLESLM